MQLSLLLIISIFSFEIWASPKNKCALKINKIAGSSKIKTQTYQGVPVTSDGFVNFNKIKPEDYLKLSKASYKKFEKKATRLINSPKMVTYKNTINHFVEISNDFEFMIYLVHNMNSMKSSKDVSAAFDYMMPKESEIMAKLFTNKKFFNKVKLIYDKRDSLSMQQRVTVEKIYQRFVENGVDLPKSKKNLFVKTQAKLQDLSSLYSQNILKAKAAAILTLTKDQKELLKDSPQELISLLKAKDFLSGKSESLDIEIGDFNILHKILTKSPNSKLRELAYNVDIKIANEGKTDNKSVIKDILTYRKKLADILGHDNYSEVALKNTLANNPKDVETFLRYHLDQSSLGAQKEIDSIKEFAKNKYSVEKVNQWDMPFYTLKYKKDFYKFDEEHFKKFFEINNTLENGVFPTFEKLHNVTITPTRRKLPTWDKEVTTYQVKDENGRIISYLYFDLLSRPSEKKGGAWKVEVHSISKLSKKGNAAPRIIVSTNSSPDSKGNILLTPDEVSTLFHEMGHVFDAIYMKGENHLIRGTSRDYVELPSQFMENYFYFSPENIKSFAKHYKTGKTISNSDIGKIAASTSQMKMGFLKRQASLAWIDLQYHMADPSKIDIANFEKHVLKEWDTSSSDSSPYILKGTNFSHIFSGGYDSQYYAYLWSDMYAQVIWQKFKQTGIFDQDLAKKFRDHVLGEASLIGEKNAFEKFIPETPDKDILIKYYRGELD